MSEAWHVYRGSNGAETRAFYSELEKRGIIGVVAVNLFRAQKCSKRAKKYGPFAGAGGKSYRSMAYERKGWSLKELSKTLVLYGETLGIGFGWGKDAGSYNPHVLYVDLPDIGQVSFHSVARYEGPTYPGKWDGRRASEERIIKFCQNVYEMQDELEERFEYAIDG